MDVDTIGCYVKFGYVEEALEYMWLRDGDRYVGLYIKLSDKVSG